MSTSVSQRIFSHIIKELKKWLTSELYFIQKAQLDINLEYNATLILPEEYENIMVNIHYPYYYYDPFYLYFLHFHYLPHLHLHFHYHASSLSLFSLPFSFS